MKLRLGVTTLCRYKYYIIFPAACFTMHFLIRQAISEDGVVANLEENVFNHDFAGGGVCKTFSCFGKTLCYPNNVARLNRSTATTVKDWFKVYGEMRNKYGVKFDTTVNVPLDTKCNNDVCAYKITNHILTERSYKTWICHKFGLKENCDVAETLKRWSVMKAVLATSGRLPPDVIRGLSPPLTCTSSRLADRVLRRVLGERGKGSLRLKDYAYADKAELLFTLKMSPATVVQQLFPPREDWLLERSLGSCGMIPIHGDSVVTSLFDLYHAPWKRRLDVAIQLLDMAHYFTDNDENYILLLHNLTPHDMGISDTGKLRIRNTDNIIVVDTVDPKQNYFNESFETPYRGKDMHIPEENLCRYKRTDVNYYVICRYLLGGSWKGLKGETLEGGLLHNPEELGVFSTKMFVLLDLCTRGFLAVPLDNRSNMGAVRPLAAVHLQRLLIAERPCSPEFKYRYPECELYHDGTGLYKLSNFELKWLR